MARIQKVGTKDIIIGLLVIIILCAVLIGQRSISDRIKLQLENTWLRSQNSSLHQEYKTLQFEYENLLTQRKQLEQEQQRRSSIPIQRASSYDELFQIARNMFSYESPLPKWPPPKAYLQKFARLPKLFEWNVEKQIQLWKQFIYKEYINSSYYDLLRDHGGMYPDLDRVVLFCTIREFKPNRIIEIGSGESTHVAQKAMKLLDKKYEHVVIEPYRASSVPTGIKVIEEEVQALELDVYDSLNDNDILFIDSSHVVMPYGDTLTELISILPRLNKGVLVHIHDIFLPFDYMPNWGDKNKVYTEQWLVALLLYGNQDWEVIWGSRLMMQEHYDLLLEMSKYPLNKGQILPNGGSLWIRKKQ